MLFKQRDLHVFYSVISSDRVELNKEIKIIESQIEK